MPGHLCADCGQPCVEPLDLCTSCSSWREQKLAELEDDRLDKIARRKRFRPFGAMSGADFGEACADMAKAVERSER